MANIIIAIEFVSFVSNKSKAKEQQNDNESKHRTGANILNDLASLVNECWLAYEKRE